VKQFYTFRFGDSIKFSYDWILHSIVYSFMITYYLLTVSFHELGIYDLSASIDYVLRVTGAKKLHYVGHSMGTTGMFVLLSEKPEYNDRIADFSALAPVTAIKHMRALIRVIACPALRNWFIVSLRLFSE